VTARRHPSRRTPGSFRIPPSQLQPHVPPLQRSGVARDFPTWTHEVNARFVEMLVTAAKNPSVSVGLIAELRQEWLSLGAAARTRMARLPYLLLDMRFRDGPWWQSARTGPRTRSRAARDDFPREAAINLARALLLLVWNGLRLNPDGACVLYGIGAPVARIIVGLRLDALDELARKHFRQIRARWEDRPAVWRDLILAAQTEKSTAMRSCTLHALQLLAGELLETAGPAPGRLIKGSEDHATCAGPTDARRG